MASATTILLAVRKCKQKAQRGCKTEKKEPHQKRNGENLSLSMIKCENLSDVMGKSFCVVYTRYIYVNSNQDKDVPNYGHTCLTIS